MDKEASSREARKRLLLSHADERIDRFPVRMLLYTVGCGLGFFALGLPPAMLAFVMLLVVDLLDCWILHRPVRRLIYHDDLKKAEKITVWSGAMQGVSLGVATSIYFFLAGEEANILFVIGGLGMGAVNSAISMPKFPLVGLVRLGIYAATPCVLLSVKALQIQSFDVFNFTDVSGTMLLMCMVYMFAAFTKSGMNNFRITQALETKKTELKTANARMLNHQKELRKLSLVARKANDSVVLSDPSRRIMWVNEAFTRVTGFTSQEAIGNKIADLLAGNDNSLKQFQPIDEAVQSGCAYHGEVENITRDGRRIWVDVNLFPVHDEEGSIEFFVAIERDITEAKVQAIEMAEARRAAEEGARAKAEFLANMSHEIRTPLTGIIGMADLLSETHLTELQSQYTRTIVGSSQSLMSVINDVLDLSQLDAGRLELSPVDFCVNAFFNDTIALLGSSSQKNGGIQISLDVDETCPRTVNADESRLRQVVVNLIGNAIKFTERGNVFVRVWYEDTLATSNLCFEVEDTGIGIPEDKLGKIFDRFTQAEAETTRKFGGTGLGLTISKHIIDVMGGQISVTSKPGQGSVFRVKVPIVSKLATSEHLPADDEEKVVNYSSLEGLKVLIAEDNKTNRLLLSKYLDSLPVTLSFACDGLEAVQQAWETHPDLIFMDVSMPNMSGLDATKEIRALDIDQPCIVALTAHAFDSEMQSCLDAGMDHFLTKPIRKRELVDWIVHHCQQDTGRRISEDKRSGT